MWIAHLQSISSARTHELNTITFTHLMQLHITILCVVLRVPGEPTVVNHQNVKTRKRELLFGFMARVPIFIACKSL